MGSPEKSWWFCVIGIDSLESIKVFIIATSKIKMKVFIGGVLAVGMRHYGKDELIVGKIHSPTWLQQHTGLQRRSSDGAGKKRASLKRDAARIMSKLMDNKDLSINMDIGFLIKPKRTAFHHSPRFGTAQRCNILGFVCGSCDKDDLTRILGKECCVFRFVWKHETSHKTSPFQDYHKDKRDLPCHVDVLQLYILLNLIHIQFFH